QNNDAIVIFLLSSRRRHTRSKRDWSSDVCSSDLHRDFDHQVTATTRALLALAFDAHGLTVLHSRRDTDLLGCPITGRDAFGDPTNGFSKANGDPGFDIRALGWARLLLLETAKTASGAAKAPEDVAETALASATGLTE